MKFFLGICSILVFCLLSSCAYAALQSDIWQYCSYNYANSYQCFDTLDGAEAFMRTEPPSGPSGRRFLELTGDPQVSGSISNPDSISYSYTVKPRGPKEYLEDYTSSISKFIPNIGVTCGCGSSGSNVAGCDSYGNDGGGCPSYPHSCLACATTDGDISALKQAFKDYISNVDVPGGCDVQETDETSWPSPPDSVNPFYGINGQFFPDNTGEFLYHNAQNITEIVPFNKYVTFQYYKKINGQCSTVQAFAAQQYRREQRFTCDEGLFPRGGVTNPQDYYASSSIIPMSQVCYTPASGTVVASQLPSDQCSEGNPCVPGNGAKIQTETDFRLSDLSVERHYHSLRLASSNSYLGPSWYLLYGQRLSIPSDPAYIWRISEEGTIERLDRIGTTSEYRSVNVQGAVAYKNADATWEFRLPSGRIEDFDVAGRLISLDMSTGPTKRLTLSYATGTQLRSDGSLLAPNGALRFVTDIRGRVIAFEYSPINSGAVCGVASADPACAGVRLTTVRLPDNTSIQYAYDTSGNLVRVTNNDGTSRQYVYNESTNICPSDAADACAGGFAPSSGFPHLLTGITDYTATNTPYRLSTYQYDYRGRVITSRWSGGAKQVTLRYPNFSTTQVVFANDGGGLQKQLGFTTNAGMFRHPISTAEGAVGGGAAPFSSGRTYDSTLGRITSRTDSRGVVSTYEYSSNNLHQTAVVEAQGTLSERRVERVWDDALNVVVEQRVVASASTKKLDKYTYNASGQIVATCAIDPSVNYTCSDSDTPPTKVRRSTYSYCAAGDGSSCPVVGFLKSINGPRPYGDTGMAGLDDTQTFTYYSTTDESGCGIVGGVCHRVGDLWKTTNPLGQVTEMVAYDKSGRVVRSKDVNGTITDFAFNSRGWLLSRTVRANASGVADSSNDATTSFLYDILGNVTRATQPDGAYLNYSYDAAYRLTDIVDNLGNRTQYTLDAAGNRTKEQVFDATYNPAVPGQGLKRSLTRVYDQLNRLTQTFDAQNQLTLDSTSFDTTGVVLDGFDGNGNRVHAKDGLNVETVQQYDALNRLTSTIQDYVGVDPATQGAQTSYAYDVRDNLLSVTDPDGLPTSYTYDGLDDLTELNSPDTGITAYHYDLAGNRTSETDARGVTATNQYDVLNRLISISYPTTSLNITFSYDEADALTGCSGSFPKGRLTTMHDHSGSTTYCYDRRGNVTREAQVNSIIQSCTGTCGGGAALVSASMKVGAVPSQAVAASLLDPVDETPGVDTPNPTKTTLLTLVTSFTYNNADRLASLTYPTGAIATYGRDSIGRISSVSWKASSTATPITLVSSTSYLPFGPLASLTFGNGRVQTKAYDADYTIDRITSSAAGGLTLDLGVDKMGNIVSASSAVAPTVPDRKYYYDALYRLTSVKTGSNINKEAYSYNLTGDRLSSNIDFRFVDKDYEYVGHHLVAVDGNERTYDENGNAKSSDMGSLSYDDRIRLAGWQLSGGDIDLLHPSALYDFNGKGERVTVQSMSYTDCFEPNCAPSPGTPVGWVTGTTAFVYGQAGGLLGEYAGQINGQINPYSAGEYIYLDSVPIAVVRNSNPSYIETDHLGTPRQVIDRVRNVAVWKWDFLANTFGNSDPDEDPDGDSVPFVMNLRYPGQLFDSETALNYNYFRDYEPATGRYVESDPVGLLGGKSTYGYALQQPTRFIDANGLIPNFFTQQFPRLTSDLAMCIINPITCKGKFCRAGNAIYHPFCDQQSCGLWDPCPILAMKAIWAQTCLANRLVTTVVCFEGISDPGHDAQIDIARAKVEGCRQLLAKCAACFQPDEKDNRLW